MPCAYSIMLATAFGVGGTYRILNLTYDWGDLDTPVKPIPDRLNEHFGAVEGGRIFQQISSSIESVDIKLPRTRPDLGREEGN